MKKLIAAVTILGGPELTIETGRVYDPKKHKLDKDEKARLIANRSLVEVDDGETQEQAAARAKAEADEAAALAAEIERRAKLTPEELAKEDAQNAA